MNLALSAVILPWNWNPKIPWYATNANTNGSNAQKLSLRNVLYARPQNGTANERNSICVTDADIHGRCVPRNPSGARAVNLRSGIPPSTNFNAGAADISGKQDPVKHPMK